MRRVLLVAGGTGGHINTAIAIGDFLEENGYEVNYLTGKRILDYKLFKDKKVTHLSVRHLRTKNPLIMITNLTLNLFSFFRCLFLIISYRPKLLLGCGGYVCGPALSAGKIMFKRYYIIEQNAVAGLTNKILSFGATKIFTHFKNTKGLEKFKNKIIVSGNPVRGEIKKASVNTTDETRIFVFGGSLGAEGLNKFISKLDLKNVVIHHQVGLANIDQYKINESEHYKPIAYIDNIQDEYDWCTAIICRAGASTVAEMRMVQKPVIFIPFPAATDNHQEYNAKFLKEEASFPVKVILEKDLNQEIIKNWLVEISGFKASSNTGDQRYSPCQIILDEMKV